MASSAETFRIAMAGYEAAIIEDEAAFRRAQLSGDQDEMVRASMSIASIRATQREYNSMAASHAQSMQANQPANRYGLSATEAEIARNSFGPIKVSKDGQHADLTNDEKERLYAENRAKLAHKRATGEYRQTTEQTG